MKGFMKFIGSALIFIGAVWIVLFLKPVKVRSNRAFYREDDPDLFVIAHRGGRGLAPEGTMAAFDNAADLGVDMFEYDIHLTADGELVVIHDPTVDRTTNGEGRVNEMTLAEVQSLDAGYQFKDDTGNLTFRDQGVYIPTVEEVFTNYPTMRQLIEIKDTNDPALYEKIIQKLWDLIQKYGMEDEVMIGSFDHKINQRFEEVSGGRIPIGAGEDEVRSFVQMHVPYLNGVAKTNVDAFQLPVEQEGHDLTTNNIIRSAKKRNISIYYWTINEEDEIKKLIDKGVDGLITDYPDRVQKVLKEINN